MVPLTFRAAYSVENNESTDPLLGDDGGRSRDVGAVPVGAVSEGVPTDVVEGVDCSVEGVHVVVVTESPVVGESDTEAVSDPDSIDEVREVYEAESVLDDDVGDLDPED